MNKYIAVIKVGSHYKIVSSSADFDENLESCEILCEKHNPLFRGQIISNKMAQLEHEYNGKSSHAISMKRLIN